MALRKDAIEREKSPVTALGVIAPPPIQVDSEAFRGSLGALFQCVRDHKVVLSDVPLFPICEAYFQYLIQRADRSLDEASVALVALAYLLEKKAWMMLPTEEPEPEALEDSTDLPFGSVAEYESAIEVLKIYQEERAKCFFRHGGPGGDYELPVTLNEIDLFLLAQSFAKLLERATPPEFIPTSRERRSLSEMIGYIFGFLKPQPQSLLDIIPQPFTREDAVYSFLALLELVRLGQAVVSLTETEVLFARSN